MKISVITPTKDRPEIVELCQRWFREQTYPVHEHIIADHTRNKPDPSCFLGVNDPTCEHKIFCNAHADQRR